MYWSPPSAEQMQKMPWRRVEDYIEPITHVWDDNWDVLYLFAQYSTQLRIGASGPIGFDFNVYHHALDRKGIVGDDFDEWIEKLKVIETHAISAIFS